MFGHVFKTQLRVLLADRSTVFWAIAFPLILATLFNFAFGNLNDALVFKAVPVAVVNDSAYQSDKPLNQSLQALTNGDHKVLDVKKLANKDDALKQLADRDVDGIITSDGTKSTVTVRGDVGGFNETIVTTAVTQSLQTTSAITAALAKDPAVATQLSTIGATNYLHDTTNTSVDRTVLYFYSLIGMACMYAGLFGIYSANMAAANLSKLGARLSVAPISKLKGLLAGLAASYVIALAANAILYLFLTQVLHVSFGVDVWPIALIMAAGSLTGLAIGTLIGTASTRPEITKINTLTMSTLACSMLAGMMGTTTLKHDIDQHAPLLAAINPVNNIADALYSTYYFGIGQRYWQDVVQLLIFATVVIVAAWWVARRKTYASL